MILANVVLVANNQTVTIEVKKGKISAVLTHTTTDDLIHIQFEDAIAFPGLINSHDHLDFNLFDQLGDGTYENYTEWAKHIHQKYSQQIVDILKIPILLREHWGIYKNLICGVTTVVNHGPKLKLAEKLINVVEDGQSLHSVHFEKWWKIKLNNPFKRNKNVVMHIGEGIDQLASKEIDTLIKWNLLNRNLIGIHGVAMDAKQAAAFKALIWCPLSNYFLLNETANISAIKKSSPILFGTDSTLTANWNIWDHLNFARNLNVLTDQELYDSSTTNPAEVWRQTGGKIEKGAAADIVVAKRKNNPEALDAFFSIQPSDLLAVICKGKILLFDESLNLQLQALNMDNYQKIAVNGSLKYVFGTMHELIKQIQSFQPKVKFPVEIVKNP